MDLQSLTPTTIVSNHLAEPTPTSLPPPQGFLPGTDDIPDVCTSAAYLFSEIRIRCRAPRRLATTGCPLEVDSTLKSCSRCGALRSPSGFTRWTRQQLSWSSRSFRVSFRATLGLRPPLLEVVTSTRYFCGCGCRFHIAMETTPLMEFLPSDAHSLLEPAEHRGYCFP